MLPWERDSGAPSGVGVCLSGGGLRSASYSMGVLEALQSERGLLFGPLAADYLAVVSGGSYTGATALLNASRSTVEMPPLGAGAPESAHVVSTARYLLDDGRLRLLWRASWRVVVALLASVGLFAWAGFITADVAVVATSAGIPAMSGWLSWPAFVVFTFALGALGASQVRDTTTGSLRWAIPGLIVAFALAPTFLAVIDRTGWLHSPREFAGRWAICAAAVFAATSLVGWFAAARVPVANAAVRTMTRAAAALVLCWATAAMASVVRPVFSDELPLSSGDLMITGVVMVAALVGGLWASYVHDVVSFHSPYRDLLARCFGVRRHDDAAIPIVPATEARISALVPPTDAVRRHPRLLVCATANVDALGRRRALPFVFSHDRSGICGCAGASYATDKLELGTVRNRVFPLRGREPEASLLGAVAITGAAIAPAMGTKTIEGLRLFFALFNVRTGVWLPNPLSPARRKVVEDRPRQPKWWSSARDEHGGFGPGFTAVLGEALGVHSRHAKRLYVSDGGHYDNLGLLALLRARCSEIWCVDAFPRRRHLGRQLRTVVALAHHELGVTISIDTDAFSLVAGSDHIAHLACAIGTITYPDTAVQGRLVVIKSALTVDTPRRFHEYRRSDRKFPYHSTLVQWYGRERFDMYRQLGAEHARAAVLATQEEDQP